MKMKLKIDKFTTSEKVFFFAYGLYLFFGILQKSFYAIYIADIYKIIIAAALVILVIREITFERTDYTVKRVILAVLFVAIILLLWRAGEGITQKDVAIMLMIVFSGRNVPFKKIARFTIYVATFALVLIFFGAYTGIIQNYVNKTSDGRVRCYMGFRYALYPSMIAYNITALIVYQNRENPSFAKSVLLLVFNYIIYSQTNSRLSFGLAVLTIMLPLLVKLIPFKDSKLMGILVSCSFIICAALSLWLTITYSSSIGWKYSLNKVLGKRLSLGQTSLLKYGISMLGQRGIEWVGNGLDIYGNKSTDAYLYVDSFYIQILQRYGVIPTVVLILLLSVSIYQFWTRKDYYMVLILGVFAIHGIIDDLTLYLFYNTFWFAIEVVLMRHGQEFSESVLREHRIRGGGICLGNIGIHCPAYATGIILPIGSRGGAARCFG